MGYMAGAKGLLYLAAAPVAGTDAVHTITFGGAPAGTFSLTVMGFTTAPITWSAVPATLLAAIQTALDGIPGVGAGQIVAAGTLTGGLGPATLTYSGANVSKRVVPMVVVVTQPAPGTLVAALTTAGVDMNPPFPRKGCTVINETTGILVTNQGSPLVPNFLP